MNLSQQMQKEVDLTTVCVRIANTEEELGLDASPTIKRVLSESRTRFAKLTKKMAEQN